MNILLFLLLLITILSFCASTVRYIRYRTDITKTVEALKMDNKDTSEYHTSKSLVNLDSWIVDNSSKLSRIDKSSSEKDESWCKDLILEIADDDYSDDVNICDKLGGRICENVKYTRVDIPRESETTFYASNGTLLLPGHSYCLYKQPPISQSGHHCDDVWGFWVYSPKYERWMCQSRVPGIYNAATHAFEDNHCGKNGQLLFDGKPIELKKSTFRPEEFYSETFQERFSCQCPKGYIFDPAKSRTTCFKDPCLASLPPYAAATGYKNENGIVTCDCGPFFYNINGDETFPCTACPYNSPQYDEKNHTLTVFIKCKRRRDSNDFGLIPCETEEENITGCKKVVIKAKPLLVRDEEYSFEDRIFF